MMKKLILTLAILLVSGTAFGANFELAPGLTVDLDLDPERWQVAAEPPEQVILQVAGNSGPASVEKARRILSFNELFIWSETSGSFLMIDISPQKEGENPPSMKAIKISTDYAGQALMAEDGVTDVDYDISKVRINGIDKSCLLTADFQKGERPRKFLGVVGFTKPYWVYLYYNDQLENSSDFAEMEKMIKTATFHPSPQA